MNYYDRVKDADVDVPNDRAFLGECFGVVLTPRRGLSPIFTIIVEDDGNWFTSDSGGADVYWLADLAKQIDRARKSLPAKKTKVTQKNR